MPSDTETRERTEGAAAAVQAKHGNSYSANRVDPDPINQQASFWSRVIEIKYGQNLLFDPGGSTGRLRACPFLETWHTLLCGEVFVGALDEATSFFGRWMTWSYNVAEEVKTNRLRRTYCGRSLFLRHEAGLKMLCRQ